MFALALELAMIRFKMDHDMHMDEARRKAAWQARFDAASHDERMEMLELEKIRQMGKLTQEVKTAGERAARATHTVEYRTRYW